MPGNKEAMKGVTVLVVTIDFYYLMDNLFLLHNNDKKEYVCNAKIPWGVS